MPNMERSDLLFWRQQQPGSGHCSKGSGTHAARATAVSAVAGGEDQPRAEHCSQSRGTCVGRWSAWLLASVLITLAGCTPVSELTLCESIRGEEQAFIDLFAEFVRDQQLTSNQIDALVLSVIPIDLQIVLNDPDKFTITEDHPLFDVPPGTVIGSEESSVAFFSGCWGRIETEHPYDDASDPNSELKVAEAWRVHVFSPEQNDFIDNPTLDAHSMEGVDGVPCALDDRPVLKSFPEMVLSREDGQEVLETDDGRLTLHTGNGQAAGLDDDGGLSLHEVGTMQASFAINTRRIFYFSVDGDFLVTSEPDYDPAQHSVEDVDLWVRFDCPR